MVYRQGGKIIKKRVGQKSVISKKFDFVNKSLFPVVELELSGRQFEVGDKVNTVRVKTVYPQTLNDVS